MSQNLSSQSSLEAIKHGSAGMIASVFTWLTGAAKWYVDHMDSITGWFVHIAQLGGLVIMFYTIRILRRNWKTGSNSRNPLEQPK